MKSNRPPLLPFVALALLACLLGGCGDDDGQDPDASVTADVQVDVQVVADASIDADLRRCGSGGEACGDCHGTAGNPAPPPDLGGLMATTEITVGAHLAHGTASTFAAAMTCTDCHVSPQGVFDKGHCDSTAPAEVEFGGTAIAGGTYPSWDRSTASCSMTYCHGATLQGGTNPTPSWTDSTAMNCGSCHEQNYHGLTECSCHTTVWSGGQIVNPSLHVNGVVDM